MFVVAGMRIQQDKLRDLLMAYVPVCKDVAYVCYLLDDGGYIILSSEEDEERDVSRKERKKKKEKKKEKVKKLQILIVFILHKNCYHFALL